MAKKTKTNQQVEVGDGLALGILTSGIQAITSNKVAVEFAFRHAWRRWTFAAEYPQVKAGPKFDDIYVQIIGRSENRRFCYALWRTEGKYLFPHPTMKSWTVLESADALAESSGVPETAWLELATLFLSQLKDSEKFVYEKASHSPLSS